MLFCRMRSDIFYRTDAFRQDMRTHKIHTRQQRRAGRFRGRPCQGCLCDNVANNGIVYCARTRQISAALGGAPPASLQLPAIHWDILPRNAAIVFDSWIFFGSPADDTDENNSGARTRIRRSVLITKVALCGRCVTQPAETSRWHADINI